MRLVCPCRPWIKIITIMSNNMVHRLPSPHCPRAIKLHAAWAQDAICKYHQNILKHKIIIIMKCKAERNFKNYHSIKYCNGSDTVSRDMAKGCIWMSNWRLGYFARTNVMPSLILKGKKKAGLLLCIGPLNLPLSVPNQYQHLWLRLIWACKVRRLYPA